MSDRLEPFERNLRFSPRQVQILNEMAKDGPSNKTLADRLGCTEATIKVMMKAIFWKTGFENRTQIALWAFQNGFGEGGWQ